MLTILVALLAAPTIAQDGPRPPRGGSMMMRADAAGDGVVTRAEALTQAGERFDRMDANRDGKLTADELATMPRLGRGSDMPPLPPANRAAPEP